MVKDNGMNVFWDSIKQGVSIVTDVGLKMVINNVRDSVDDIVEDTQKKIEATATKVMKSFITLSVILFGCVLAIVGLGKFLGETVPALNHGLGYVLVGGILIIIGFITLLARR